MTADRDKYSCEKCRRDFSPGRHIVEPDDPNVQPYYVECPNKAATLAAEAAAKVAREFIADESTKAVQAGKAIIEEAFASRGVELSANDLAAAMDAAQIPEHLRGSAWRVAIKAIPLERTGRMVPHRDPGTRHRIDVWRRAS